VCPDELRLCTCVRKHPGAYGSIIAFTTIVIATYTDAMASTRTANNSRTTQWLSPAEMTAWRSYVETVGDLTSALERDLAPTGLTSGDYQVLVVLSERDEHQMRMCDLAEVLQLSPSGLTRRLDGLVRSGLVQRQPSSADRRVMLAVLTDAGWERLNEAAPIHVASVRRRVLDHLDPEEIHALGRVFGAIRQGLDRDSQIGRQRAAMPESAP